jgi:hypothetical protein
MKKRKVTAPMQTTPLEPITQKINGTEFKKEVLGVRHMKYDAM